MNIKINGELVDFQLEGEEDLQQVVSGIRNWLDEQKLLVLKISADQETLAPEDIHQWGKMPLENINELNFEVNTEQGFQVYRLCVLIPFLRSFKDKLVKQEYEELNDLLKDQDIVDKEIKASLSVDGMADTESLSFKKALVDFQADHAEAMSDQQKKGLIDYLNKIIFLLQNYLDELEQPIHQLEVTVKMAEELIPKLEDASIMLQSGKDRELITVLLNTSAIIQKFLRLLSILKNDKLFSESDIKLEDEDFNSFHQSMNSILQELLSALEKKDTVLIGDLLEYEIVPRIENFSRILEQIKNVCPDPETISS